MDIILAKTAGFCFGVKRAVDMAFEASDMTSRKVRTLGPIIHNPQVVNKLGSAGIKAIESITEDADVMIVRTHGIPVETKAALEEKKVEVIDATCPIVKKAQKYAKILADEGYQVLILGDSKHPEVKSILSYAGRNATVVKDHEDLPALKSRIGIIVQTTQPLRALRVLCDKVIPMAKELKVYNTICHSTASRLKETEEIAKSVDVMLVVGGKNSANTRHLASLCNQLNKRTYHIEEDSELDKEWFGGVSKVGVTAGASTPEWIINNVVISLESIDRGGHTSDGDS